MAANEERVLHTIQTTKREFLISFKRYLTVDNCVLHHNFSSLLSHFTAELIEERKCASNEEIVRERITKLQEIWEKLTKQSQSKSRYLMESNQLQQYNNNVKELDYWLGEVGSRSILYSAIFADYKELKNILLLALFEYLARFFF
jgi:5'-deoxynucleotidase YfbR-like HD superfamily hydrolase